MPKRQVRPVPNSSATGTGSSIRPRSGGCSEKTQVFLLRRGRPLPDAADPHARGGQIARAIARALRLDEDLAEALALAHDLGHPPFGHAGERALNAKMAGYGGFDHNAQALRVVTRLERRYPSFDGLNLTWETLEGMVKHNGPLTDADGRPVGRYAPSGMPAAIADVAAGSDLWLCDLSPAWRRRPRPSPTTSPTTPTTSTTALRAGLLSSRRLTTCRWSAASLKDIALEYSGAGRRSDGHTN